MLKSFLVFALRSFRKQKLYSFINVTGLAVGMAACLLIVLFVIDERSYDRFHENADRIYRVVADRRYDDGEVRPLAPTSPPLAPILRSLIPEIEQTVRLFNPEHTTGRSLLRRNETHFYEKRFFYADPEVFDVFSLPLISGNKLDAFRDPYSVVISESMARKYFEGEDPLGKTLVLDDSLTLEVSGVMRDLPSHTHLKIDFLAPFSLVEIQYGEWVRDLWGWDLIHTYLLIREGQHSGLLARKVQAVLDEHVAPLTSNRGYKYVALLQPLTDIHLHSDREWEIETNSNPLYSYALSVVGIFVLLIACINFINLSTAKFSHRVREIGIRKTLGGRRRQLILQFLCESTLLSLLATLLAVSLVQLFLPILEEFLGINFRELPVATIFILLLVTPLLVGFGTGIFPAFHLTSLRPALTLKGNLKVGKSRFRKGLVVLQFVLSIVLITGTAIVYQQLQFARSKQLGFQKENVLVLDTGLLPGELDAVKQELLRFPGINHVSAASGVPGGKIERMQVVPEGKTEPVPVKMLWVDHDFLQTLNLRLIAGRSFSRDYTTDETQAFVINEAAAQTFGWQNPIGKELTWAYFRGIRQGTVIGLTEDFHIASLKDQIEPLVLLIRPPYRYLAIRIEAGAIPEVLVGLERWWKTTAPGHPFTYSFFDESFDTLYVHDQRFARLVGFFAGLAISIACLGLFGLAAFTAEKRTKEIGIRKVLGASVASIVALLSKDFLQLVLVAFVIATPLVYLAMSRWLESFAYRIELGPVIFLLAGTLALLIALATVSYQSLRAALADPVKNLRQE